MTFFSRLIAFMLPAAGLVASPCVTAQWFADAGVESAWHDNLTRSEHGSDAREDASLALLVSGGIHLQPGLYTGLTFTGTLSHSRFRRYSDLTNTEAGLAVTASRKFGLGDRQPILTADFGVTRNEYHLGIRDAWIYRAGLGLRKRLTDTLQLSAGMRYEQRDGDHDVPRDIPLLPRPGSSWDLRVRNVFATAEQDLGARTWISANYQYQRGDVVSTAVPYAKIFSAATAITLDPLYGPLAVAYRIPARTHILAVDLNRAVFDSGTVYLGFEYQRTHGAGGIDYDSSVLRSGFIHSF